MADPGICPTCGKPLEYGNFYLVEKKAPAREGYYPVTCTGRRCSFQGREWYAMEFVVVGETR